MSSVKSQREKPAVAPAVRSRSSPVKDHRAKPSIGQYRVHGSRRLGRPVVRPSTGRHAHQKPRYKTNCLSDHAPYEQLHDELSKDMVKKVYDMCAADNGRNLKLLEILLGERPGVLATLEALDCKRYSALCELRSCLQKLNIWSMAEWEQQAGAGVCDMENGALALIQRAARFIGRASTRDDPREGCTTIECTVSIAPLILAKSAKNNPNDDGDDGAEDDDDDGDDVKYDECQPKQPTNAASHSFEQHICTGSVDNVFLAAQEILKSRGDREDEYRHFMATLKGQHECRLSKLKNVKKNARIHQQGQLSFLTLLCSIVLVPKRANTLTVLQTSVNKSVKKYVSVTDERGNTFIGRLNEEGDIPPQLSALSPALDFTGDAESEAFAKHKRDFLYWLRIHVQINRTVNEHNKKYSKPVNANRIRNVVASLISKRAEFFQTLHHRGIPRALCDALWHDLGGAPLSEIELAVTNENENDDDGGIELEQLNEEIRETIDIDVSVGRNVGNHDGGRDRCDGKSKSRQNSKHRQRYRHAVKRQLPSCSQLKATAFNWKPCGSAWQRTALVNILKDEQQRKSIVSGTRWTWLPRLDHVNENGSSVLHCVEYPKPPFVGTLLQTMSCLHETEFTDLVLFPVYNDQEEQFMHLYALCVDSDTDTYFQFAIVFEVKQGGMLHAPDEDSKDDDDDEDVDDVGVPQVSVVEFYNTRAIRQRCLRRFLKLGNCLNLPSSWIHRTHFLNPDRLEVYENQPQSMMAMRCVQFMEACLAQDMDEKQIEDQVQILKGKNYNYVPGDFTQDETLWRKEMQAFARETQWCSHQWSTDVCKLWCIFTMKPTAQQSTMKGPTHCWYISRTAFAHKSIGPIVSKYQIDRFEIFAKHASYSVFSELKAFLVKRNNLNGKSFDAFLAFYGA